MTDADRHLDEVLRRVPLPEHLRGSLAPEELFADAPLDRLLAAVAVPHGLAERVRSAARSGGRRSRSGVVDLARFADLGGERSLAVPSPAALFGRRRVNRLLGLAREAGRVGGALGMAVMLAVAGFEASRRLEGPSGPSAGVAAEPAASGQAPSIDALPDRESHPLEAKQAGAELAPARPLPATASQDGVSLPWPWDQADIAAVVPATASPSDVAAETASEIASPAMPPRIRGAAIPPAERDRQRTLAVLAAPSDTQRRMPRSAAYDVAFEMAHGESPFIQPATDPALAVDRPPLSLRSDGFELLTGPECVRRPRSLPERIRAEQVLAAMPAPRDLQATVGDDEMRLGVFTVRSGRAMGGKPTLLLEAAAFAAGRPLLRTERLAATVILDQSAAGDPRAWVRICRGVAGLAERLGPGDRISVVLAGPRPRVAVRDAAPTELIAAAGAWEALPAAGSSDLDAAIETARIAGLLDRHSVIVAHANTVDNGRGTVRELLASWHRGRALADGGPVAGPRFVILDPATPAADTNATFGRTSPDALAIRRELTRQVTGEDTLVARRCRLELRFDPTRVAAYRLIGHRQSVLESLAGVEPVAIDLHAGETVRAVYEVVPRGADGPGLVTASFTWRAADGTLASLEAADQNESDRRALLPSPHGCELLLAATLAELAAGSPHMVQPRSTLTALAALGDRWRDRGDITPFGELLAREIERRATATRSMRGR